MVPDQPEEFGSRGCGHPCVVTLQFQIDHPLGVGSRERPEDHCVHQGEHGRGHADAHAQGQDGGQGEDGAFPEASKAELEVPGEIPQDGASLPFPDPFSVPVSASEGRESSPSGL